MKRLNIDQIQTEGLQARVATCEETVADYAEKIAAGVEFPPVVVFNDGRGFYLADGFHRVLASQRAGKVDVAADIRKGTPADARWFSSGCNVTHGLRRTNADKRRAVEIALSLKPGNSDRAIADHCGVGHSLVSSMRQVSESATCPRMGQDGKTYPPPPKRPVPTRPPERQPDPEDEEKPRVQAVMPPPKRQEPPAVLDNIGRPIPAHLIELWDRSQEVQDYLTTISRLRGALRAAAEDADPLWADTNTTHALSHLDQAYTTIKNAIPHTLCPVCQGATPAVSKTCTLCKGRGLISEFKWDRAVPKETKDLILKTLKKPTS